MSLRAKLEAVIYAAEEPVTLAQLAALFAEDALVWKAARAAEIAQAVGSEASEDPQSTIGILEMPLNPVARAATPEDAERPAASADAAPEAGVEPVTGSEFDAKRLVRLREREVREILRSALDQLIAEYAQDCRGIEIREIAGGFRMGTKPEIHDAVRAFVRSLKPPLKLSLPALETLAVVAYKQPVTGPEVGEIRGVDSAGVLGSLLGRKLIATAGRKQVIGRPILYKTTKEFLLRFGLKDLHDLPSMEEFEKMAALELSEEPMDESSESDEPVELSGDLFAESKDSEGVANEPTIEEPKSHDRDPGHTEASVHNTEVSIPAAEPSEEAAAAYALVEDEIALEVEVEQ